MAGQLFEVTPSNQIVWEYISPFLARNQHGLNNGVFRAHRYDPDHPALSGRQLDPSRHGNLNRLYGISLLSIHVTPRSGKLNGRNRGAESGPFLLEAHRLPML